MADLTALEKTLGVSFRERSLLEQALVHSSYINETAGIALQSNERLEFLGDAVLGVVIADRLYEDLPAANEGKLTRLRAALVRRETLAAVGRALRLGDHLFMGRGEEAGGGRDKLSNLAGAVEAVIGAVYLDAGLETARLLILRLFTAEIGRVAGQFDDLDYKSRLQELIQGQGKLPPTYHLVEEAGPAHARAFTVEVRVDRLAVAQGKGMSKKAAEADAARQALENAFTHETSFAKLQENPAEAHVMGSRDFGKREAKKTKKDTKKAPIISSATNLPPPPVEVIKKVRKPKEQEE